MEQGHLDTPKKARIRYTLLHLHEDEYKTDIFREFNISRSTGYRILKEPEERQCRIFHNIKGCQETRGRPKKLSDDDVQKLVQYIRTNSWKPDGRKPGYAGRRWPGRGMQRRDRPSCPQKQHEVLCAFLPHCEETHEQLSSSAMQGAWETSAGF